MTGGREAATGTVPYESPKRPTWLRIETESE